MGTGRAKKGMFEGDLQEGELEIGQVSSQMNEILSAKKIIQNILEEFKEAKAAIKNSKFNF